ncbi:hypothetical protein [Clostridium tertium]|uniref:hypothetical protein n=1 Tax=Clostridium tertium TaxID=1559 RepID=UPI000BE2A23F|nr:hypothetical protein [Clostridium tertium]
MINVYDDDNTIIGRVNYSTNLDFYDGRNFTCGTPCQHKGLTKLRNGNFVLIRTSNWSDSPDYAEIISDGQALQEILNSGNTELLEEKRFIKLKKLYEEMLNSDFSECDE